jgi:transposase
MSKYSASFKERVVAFYGGGERSYADVELQFGIDQSTVRKWIDLHAARGSAGLTKKRSCYDAAFKLSVLPRM